MARFRKKGEAYVGSFQGAAGRCAYIEIELSKQAHDHVRVDPVSDSDHGSALKTDPQKILSAVKEGINIANRDHGTRWHLVSLRYIPTDSRHYEIHRMLAQSIVRQIEQGQAFDEI